MRRAAIVLGLTALLALAAGCGEDEPDVAPDPDDDLVDVDSTPDPEPDDDADDVTDAVEPLTGRTADDPDALQRPVLAVKVDNHPQARPQDGLDAADVVLVELVEGATRFVGLYHSTDTERVGPVRSGRMVEADLLPAFDPVFAQSGAAGPVLERLQEAQLAIFGEGEGSGWERDPSRSAPHNLYASPAALWEAGADQPVPDEPVWDFDGDTPDGGTDVSEITVAYPGGASTVTWTWDDGEEAWLRSQDGEPHTDADGEQLRATTVVVPTMEATGDAVRPFEPVGDGEVAVFRDGQRFDGRWEKPDAETHFAWLDDAGDPLLLAPGTTWVEMLPSDGELGDGELGDGEE